MTSAASLSSEMFDGTDRAMDENSTIAITAIILYAAAIIMPFSPFVNPFFCEWKAVPKDGH